MQEENVTSQELADWMEAQRKKAPWLAQTIGTTKATVGRWLKGAPIPDTSQKLLKLLLRGEMPPGFAKPHDPAILAFTAEEWRIMEICRIREGYPDTKAWIVAKIRAYLAMSQPPALRAAEEPATYTTSPKRAAQ